MIGGDGISFGVRERFDWVLFVTAASVAVLGVVNLYSATSVYTGALAEYYVNQLYWLVAGGILAVAVAFVDYRTFERFGYLLHGFGVLLLVLVFVLGRGVRGATRWIPIGSFQFQPSEFTKISLMVALAKFFHDDPRVEARSLADLLLPAAMTLVPVALILKQPDLGTGMIHVMILVSISSMLRLRRRDVAALAIAGGIGAPLAWMYGLKDYQKQRVLTFLDPEADLRGAGWHAHHARVAIGNGAAFGQGYMRGSQNQFKFLPEQYSDLPFAVFAEDWGFVGGLVLIGLYMLLVLWSIRVASQAKDRFGAVLAIGVGAMIFWHAFINLGMVSGILPMTGVTLPLFSYGGSSCVAVLIGIGLLMSVSMRSQSYTPSRRGDLVGR
jgi:rod shape determining protein RodA